MKSKILAPCEAACPVHTDGREYARLVAAGRYDEAYEVICRTNPFPSVCGHVCQRLCEKHCRRSAVDAAVALRALKRFVVDHSGAPRPKPQPMEQAAQPARLAVVGAGPAGLTAAFDLRLRGHRVEVFERLDRPGGMLNVIPRYRLPESAVQADVEAIREIGVEITCGYEIGRQATVTGLLERGFGAVIVTTGLSRSRGIAVPGFGGARFTAAVPWMTDVWLGNEVDLGQRVAVIGGGNVAVDVARTARRLGAKYVAMICLESPDEIPAEPDEIRLAEAEGIHILHRQALKRVLNRDGRIAVLELMAVTSVFDETGRFHPTYDPSRIRTLAADMVVLSVGQAGDRSWARGSAIATDARGRIAADRDTHATSHPRVFLAGESLRGPGSAIQAVADGHRVASVVSRFLATGETVGPPPDDAQPLAALPEDAVARLRRMQPVVAEAEPFASAEPAVDEVEARREGDRCLGCLYGAEIDEVACASCLTCYRVCPMDAIEIGEAMTANPVRCQACGLCAAVCPAKAVDLTYWVFPAAVPGEGAAVGEGATVTLICRHREDAPLDAENLLRVPCLARLRPVDLLRLIRHGYRMVTLEACEEEACKYGSSWPNIQSLVTYVERLVKDTRPDVRIEVRVGRGAAAAGAVAEGVDA